MKYTERCYEVHTTRVTWTPDELSYGRKYWRCTDEREREQVVESGRTKERAEPSSKHEVAKRAEKEKRGASAATATGRKPEDSSVSPPLQSRKFEKYIDEVPMGVEGTEHLFKIPEGVVREVLGGNDRVMSYQT